MVQRKSRGKKTKTRRKKQPVSVIGLAETYLLLNVATQTLFKTNPYVFLMGDRAGMYASGTSAISLRELFRANQHSSGDAKWSTMNVVTKNFKDNWFKGAVAMAVIPAAFSFGKNLARPAITRSNRLLKNMKLKAVKL